MLWLPVTAYRSLRSFHGLASRPMTLAFTAWMAAAFAFGFWIYVQLLFLLTLFSLRDLSVAGS